MIETPFEDLIYPNYDYIYQVANFDDVTATFVLQHPARLLKGHTPAPWEGWRDIIWEKFAKQLEAR